jgi:DNA-binding PucR family transcriptional regulator
MTAGVGATTLHRDAIVDVVRVMSADLDGVARELTDAIHANLAELEDDLRLGTHQSCRSNLGMIMTMLAEGTRPSLAVPPAEALAYAKEYVNRHHGLELLQRAYRTAQASFSQMWLEQLRVRAEDADELAHTFGFFNEWLFAWVETLESRLTEYYMAERERHLRGVTAMRADEVRAILEGASVDVVAASRRLRYELDRSQLAFVIWAPEAQRDHAHGHVLFATMEQLAAETAKLIGARDHMTVPLHGYLACWAGFREPPVLENLPAGFPARSRRRLHVAFGALGEGIAGFRRSHEEALLARRVHLLRQSAASAYVHFGDVALDALLMENPAEARRFVARQLGSLAEDSDAASRLRTTVSTFLQENASFLHTARRLGVHENTVAYRIRRAEELLGRELKCNQVELQTALRLAQLNLP